jgi:hypothetical protein
MKIIMDYKHIKNVTKNINKNYIVQFSECFEGEVITIAHKNLSTLCTIVIYPDDVIYISWLSVDREDRGRGLANNLLQDIETIFKTLNKKMFRLLVERYSWKYEWYIRKGFTYESDFDSTWCYMFKKII